MNVTRSSLLLALPLASAACMADVDLGHEADPSFAATSGIQVDLPDSRTDRTYEPSESPDEALQPGTSSWIRRVGGVADERAGGLALGGTGEVLLTGSFHHWVDFGAGDLYAPAGDDIFVTAMGPSGQGLWARQLSGLGDERGMAVAGTPDGGYVVVGSFPGDINLGAGSRLSRGGLDAFAARYDDRGAHMWSYTWGGAGEDTAVAVGVDGRGNVVVAGSFEGTASVAGANINSAGGRDLYTASFDVAGSIEVRRHGGDGDDVFGGLSVTQDGAYALAATFRWTNPEIDLADPLAGDAIVIAHDRAGSVRWVGRVGGDGIDSAGGVVMAEDGSVAVAVSFSAEVAFGDRTYRSAGGSDAMLAVYDPRGAESWATTLGGPEHDAATGVAIDPMRGPVLTGTFRGQIGGQLDTATRAELPLTVHGGSDVFAIGYGFEGRIRWMTSAGGADNDTSAGVVIDHDGTAVIAGSFTGELFAPGAGVKSSGGRDLFILGIAQ